MNAKCSKSTLLITLLSSLLAGAACSSDSEPVDSWTGTLTINAMVGSDSIMETRPNVSVGLYNEAFGTAVATLQTETPKDNDGVYLACLFELATNDAMAATVADSDCFVHPDSSTYGYEKLAGGVTKTGDSMSFQLQGETYSIGPAENGSRPITPGTGAATISFTGTR